MTVSRTSKPFDEADTTSAEAGAETSARIPINEARIATPVMLNLSQHPFAEPAAVFIEMDPETSSG
jgi:hypothetical protein